MSYLLLLLILVPLGGALIGAILPASVAKAWALLVSLFTLACCGCLLVHFNFHQQLLDFPFTEQAAKSVQIDYGGTVNNPFSVDSVGFHFDLGVDSISLLLVALTVFAVY